jgi:hypothetical protein
MTLAVLLSIALLYPITATQGRFRDRFNESATPLTLDGMEFMLYGPHGADPDGRGPKPGVWFNLRGDYHLIRWMQDNISGTPTIIEGQHVEYSWASRVAIHTGLPTVLGWRHHQSQQRNLEHFDSLLNTRLDNVRAFYTLPDIDVAWNIIQFYDIEYVIVGTFERIIYEDIKNPDPMAPEAGMRHDLQPGITKFETMVELGLLEKVYQQPVCVDRDIWTVEDCPADHISTDIVYRVVPEAEYDPSIQTANLAP